MAVKRVILLLVCMNVGLLFMISTLAVNIWAFAGKERIEEAKAFQVERARLAGERARLETKFGVLAHAVKRLDAIIDQASSKAATSPTSEPTNAEGQVNKAPFLSVLE